MQDAGKLLPGPLCERIGRRLERRYKVLVIRRFRWTGSQHEEFLQDASLHLVRRLVGEGDGQDVAVRKRILPGEDQPDIFTGQVVCFSGSRGGFEQLYHRPQIILKSQNLQVSGLSVRRKGTAGSTSSASISRSFSRVSRANSGLNGRSSSGSVNSRVAE